RRVLFRSDPDGSFAAAEQRRDAQLDADAAAGLDPMVMRLPLPKPEAVEAWWAGHHGRFDAGKRYLYGRVSSFEIVRAAYVDGPSRRRHLLGYELTLRTRSRVQPSTRASAARQHRQLAELANERVDPQRGYLDICSERERAGGPRRKPLALRVRLPAERRSVRRR